MKKLIYPAIIFASLFTAKYIQILYYCNISSYSTGILLFLTSLFLLVAVFSLISILSALQLNMNFKWNSLVAIVGFSLLIFSMFVYPDNAWAHLYGISQIFLVASFFVYLYSYHDSTTLKFPAFGAAFLMIYVLLEYASLVRWQFDLWILITYLTITLIMFIPGFYLLSLKRILNY